MAELNKYDTPVDMVPCQKIMPIIVCLICLITSAIDVHSTEMIASQGSFDLRSWNFKTNGAASLDGEWDFFWNQFILPKKNDTVPKPDTLITVPSTWKEKTVDGEALPGMGKATYRLKVTIDPALTHQAWGVKVLLMGSAYSMWINGSKVASNGIVGSDENQSVPEAKPQVAFFNPGINQLDIIIQVSNFHHPRGGIWRSILLGPADTLKDVYRNRLISETFFMAIYLMIGLTHFVHFLVYRKRITELYFSCICLIIAMRTGFTGEHLILYATGAWHWSFQFKFAGLTIIAGLTAFLMFIDKLFVNLCSTTVLRTAQGVGLIYAGLLILTPVSFWSPLMHIYRIMCIFVILYLCFLLGKAVVKQIRYARVVLLACTILLAAAINDILLVNHIIETGYMLAYGVALFIVIQSFLLAQAFSHALQEKEIFSNRLAQMEKSQNRAVEKERFRISRELHDEVAQIFSLIRYQVSNRFKKTSNKTNESHCETCKHHTDTNLNIIQLSQKGNQKIRQVMNDLYPPELNEFGLCAAVDSHLTQMSQKAGLSVSFNQVEEIPRGKKNKELAVFRIIQEAVSNIIKHAGVDSANVSIGKNEEFVWFQVTDEGRGFRLENKKEHSDTKGRGLFFIQERARQIQGTITIHSEPSEGTNIFLILPISAWCTAGN